MTIKTPTKASTDDQQEHEELSKQHQAQQGNQDTEYQAEQEASIQGMNMQLMDVMGEVLK